MAMDKDQETFDLETGYNSDWHLEEIAEKLVSAPHRRRLSRTHPDLAKEWHTYKIGSPNPEHATPIFLFDGRD